MKALNVNKLTKSGCIFKFWVADWFAQLNNKMGGDLKKIQTVGKYMIEVRLAIFFFSGVQYGVPSLFHDLETMGDVFC